MNESDNQKGQRSPTARSQEVQKKFGERLTSIIEDEKIVQEELAKYLGCVPGYITQLKQGKQMPKADYLVGISEFTGKPVDYLLGSDQPDEPALPPGFRTLARYLWDLEKTEKIETSAQVIWDATPDFYWVYEERYWRDLVLKNITERKVKCYFLYLKTYENDKRAERHASMVENRMREAKISGNWRNLVNYVGANSDEFPFWAEHVLYDPDGDNPRCIMVSGTDYLHFGDPEPDVPNLEFTPSMTEAFAKWFKLVWNKRVTDPDWKIP